LNPATDPRRRDRNVRSRGIAAVASAKLTGSSGVACRRSGHGKNLDPVPVFALVGEPIYMRVSAISAPAFRSAKPPAFRNSVDCLS
jgi:hypothetical protein